MKRPTIRGTAKWGLTGAAVVLAVLWVGSYWWITVWSSAGKRTMVAAFRGRLEVDRDYSPVSVADPMLPGGFVVHTIVPGVALDFRRQPMWARVLGRTWSAYRLPLGWVFVLVSLPAVLLWGADWWRRSRIEGGGCSSCGYDRSGLAADAVCPECGTAPASAAP